MSLGLRKLRYESSTGVPSTMYSGSLFWNEPTPRMRTVEREPGEPLAFTVTPATCPSMRCSTLVVVVLFASWRLTLETAPVMSCRRWVVYPVTTISCKTVGAASIVTSMVPCPPTGFSVPRNPIMANVRTASAGATRAYRPCWFVTVWVCVPFTRTVTPQSLSPLEADVTVPETACP